MRAMKGGNPVHPGFGFFLSCVYQVELPVRIANFVLSLVLSVPLPLPYSLTLTCFFPNPSPTRLDDWWSCQL